MLSTGSMQHERCSCSPKWVDHFFVIFIPLVYCFTLSTHYWLPSVVFLTQVFIWKFCTDELVSVFWSHMAAFLQPKYYMHMSKPSLLEFNGVGPCNHLPKDHFNAIISDQLLFLEHEYTCHQIWSILQVFLYFMPARIACHCSKTMMMAIALI